MNSSKIENPVLLAENFGCCWLVKSISYCLNLVKKYFAFFWSSKDRKDKWATVIEKAVLTSKCLPVGEHYGRQWAVWNWKLFLLILRNLNLWVILSFVWNLNLYTWLTNFEASFHWSNYCKKRVLLLTHTLIFLCMHNT